MAEVSCSSWRTKLRIIYLSERERYQSRLTCGVVARWADTCVSHALDALRYITTLLSAGVRIGGNLCPGSAVVDKFQSRVPQVTLQLPSQSNKTLETPTRQCRRQRQGHIQEVPQSRRSCRGDQEDCSWRTLSCGTHSRRQRARLPGCLKIVTEAAMPIRIGAVWSGKLKVILSVVWDDSPNRAGVQLVVGKTSKRVRCDMAGSGHSRRESVKLPRRHLTVTQLVASQRG